MVKLARWSCASLLVWSALAWADGADAKRAKEEVERELKALVGAVPTRVRIEYVALDEPNYALEEAAFELDGKPLAAPRPSELSQEGTHLVWTGDVSPGRHTVSARAVYANRASVVVSEEGGHKWKVLGDVGFEVDRGIEVQVRVTPVRDPSQRDITKRLKLTFPAEPVMIARLEDATVPELPAERPGPAVAEATPAPADEEVTRPESDDDEEPRRAPARARRVGTGSSSTPKAAPHPAPLARLDSSGASTAAPAAPAAPAEVEATMSAAPTPALPDAGLAALIPTSRVSDEPEASEEALPWPWVGLLVPVLIVVLAFAWRSARRRSPPDGDDKSSDA